MATSRKGSKEAVALAQASGVSVTTVYNYAKKLGRLPTVEELKAGKKNGRPKKYI